MNPASQVSSRRFDKSRRLRKRVEFQEVFDKGQRGRGRFLTVVMTRRSDGGPRLGIVASRKLGNSVARNRAKRLIREMFRHDTRLSGAGLDIVVIPRRELFDAPYAHLEEDYRTVVARCAARLSL